MEGNVNNKFSFLLKHLCMPICVWLAPYRTSCLPVLFPALHLMLYLVWYQHMKGNISKCEVFCIGKSSFKLLPQVAGCEINYSRKENSILASLQIHHWKHLLNAVRWSREETDLFSIPNDQCISWSYGMDGVSRAKFSSECACLDTACWWSMIWACCS